MPHNDGILFVTDGDTEHSYRSQYQYACYQHQGKKNSQEDKICMGVLNNQDIQAAQTTTILTPEQIAHRLWTCHLQINTAVIEKKFSSGSTASTTVYDGGNHLISANLADTVCFLVLYDAAGQAIDVHRLNSTIHHPIVRKEAARVKAGNGHLINARVEGVLAMTRSLGDAEFKHSGKSPVSSEPQIDIIDITKLPNFKQSVKRQIITCSDGFTDGLKRHVILKEVQESYLMQQLGKINKPGFASEYDLAETLVYAAMYDRFYDNVSVAVLTLQPDQPAFVGVYDGHSGHGVATFTALNIIPIFIRLCTMSHNSYSLEKFSVTHNQFQYDVDHDPYYSRCSDLEFSTLYPYNLFNKKNIELLRTVPEVRATAIAESLSLLHNAGFAVGDEYEFLLNYPDLQAFNKCIRILRSWHSLSFGNYLNLKAHKNIQQLSSFLQQVEKLEFSSADVGILLSHDGLGVLSECVGLLAKNALLNKDTGIFCVRQKHIAILLNLFQHLEQIQLWNARNIILITQRGNLPLDLNVTIHKDKQIISCNGLILHNRLIDISQHVQITPNPDQDKNQNTSGARHNRNLKPQFRMYSGENLKLQIFKYFKELIELTTNFLELEACVPGIKASYEYGVLQSSSSQVGFFKPFISTPTSAFAYMIDEQKRILTEIDDMVKEVHVSANTL